MVRFKNRYITLEIEDTEQTKTLSLHQLALYKAIHNKVQELYGDLGLAAIKAGLNAKYCNQHTKIAVVKVRHGPHVMVLKALSQIEDIGGHSAKIKTLYTGATLKHCFLFIKRYQNQHVEIAFSKMKTDQDKQNLVNALMTLTPDMEDFK